MRSSRMNFGSKLGIFAMEEEVQRQTELENPVEVPVEDNANSLETDLIEAGDDEAEIEAVNDAAEDGMDTVEALESMRVVVAGAGKAGGLDAHGAAAVRVALESLYARVGMDVGQPTPALESFGGAGDRVRATIALEQDIKARIKAIWEKIKEMIKRAIEWVKELFNKYFGAAEKLEKRAKALADRANKTTGSASGTFKSARLVQALHIGGKVAGDATAAEAMAEVLKKALADVGGYTTALETLAKPDGKTDLTAALEKVKGALKLGAEQVSDPKSAGYELSAEGSLFRSAELPGGRALLIEIDPANIEHTTAGVGAFDRNATPVKTEDVPVIEAQTAKKVATAVYGVAGQLKAARSAVSKLETAKKALISAGDKAAGAAEGEEAKAANESMKSIRLALKLVDKPFVELSGTALSVGKSLCDQIEKSLSMHKAK